MILAINKATLAKEVDGVVEYIYPKTTADMVEFDTDNTVEDKINSANDEIAEARVAKCDGKERSSLNERLLADLAQVSTDLTVIQDTVAASSGDKIVYEGETTINEKIKEIDELIEGINTDITNINSGTTIMYDEHKTIIEAVSDTNDALNNHMDTKNNPNPHEISPTLIGAATVTSNKATVPSSDSWSSNTTNGLYTCTVSIDTFDSNTRAHITPVISTTDVDTGKAQQEAWDTHYYSETVNGGIKFYAEEKPTVAVEFTWEVIK
jgi:hypothetical protein